MDLSGCCLNMGHSPQPPWSECKEGRGLIQPMRALLSLLILPSHTYTPAGCSRDGLITHSVAFTPTHTLLFHSITCHVTHTEHIVYTHVFIWYRLSMLHGGEHAGPADRCISSPNNKPLKLRPEMMTLLEHFHALFLSDQRVKSQSLCFLSQVMRWADIWNKCVMFVLNLMKEPWTKLII